MESSPQTSRSDSAVQLQGIPSDLLGSYGPKPKASGLICGSQSPTENRRQLAAARWDSNVYRDQSLRNSKSKSKGGMKALIKNDLAARHTRGCEHLDLLTRDEYPDDIDDRFVSSQSCCHPSLAPLDSIETKGGGQAANAFIAPYESHIGAILGSRFQVSVFIRSEACYDVYALGDLFHEQDCFVKAYTLRGTKGKERDARLKSLKRNSKNVSLMASIDQNGRKWLVFSADLDLGKDKGTSIDLLAWHGEQEYQLHFPAIDRRCKPCQGQYATFSRSYASCFQASKDSTKNHSTTKAQRARDRQRRKRQERRVVKAKAREAVEVKKALSEKEGNVEQASSLAEPDELFKEVTPHEANGSCDSKELAPFLSDFRAASVEDLERDERQDSVHVETAEQSDSELSKNQLERGYTYVEPAGEQYQEFWTDDGDFYTIQYPEYGKVISEKQRIFAEASSPSLVGNEDDCISIPCNAPQEQCVACFLHLPKELPGSLGRSLSHLTNRADLRKRNYTYQTGRGGLLPSYSPWIEGRWSSEGDPVERVAWKGLPKHLKRSSIFDLHSRAREMSKKDLIRYSAPLP